MSDYVEPQDVNAPVAHWVLIRVIIAGGPVEEAVAVGLWDKAPAIALRWNGEKGRPNGMPFSRKSVWYILGDRFLAAVVEQLCREVPNEAAFLQAFFAKWLA